MERGRRAEYLDAQWEPRSRRGRRIVYGHYDVTESERGLLIRYSTRAGATPPPRCLTNALRSPGFPGSRPHRRAPRLHVLVRRPPPPNPHVQPSFGVAAPSTSSPLAPPVDGFERLDAASWHTILADSRCCARIARRGQARSRTAAHRPPYRLHRRHQWDRSGNTTFGSRASCRPASCAMRASTTAR